MRHKWNEDNFQLARQNGKIRIWNEPEIEWAKNGVNKILEWIGNEMSQKWNGLKIEWAINGIRRIWNEQEIEWAKYGVRQKWKQQNLESAKDEMNSNWNGMSRIWNE